MHLGQGVQRLLPGPIPQSNSLIQHLIFLCFFSPYFKTHHLKFRGCAERVVFARKTAKKGNAGQNAQALYHACQPLVSRADKPPRYAYHTQAPFPFKRSSRCECSYWVKVCSFQVIMYNLSLISVVECLNYQVEIVTRKYEWMLINVHIDDKT